MKQKSEKQQNILHFLLSGERRFSDFKELGYNDVTLTRNLKTLEKNNYISHNHLKKVYKITSRGISFLNELDDESRGKIFTADVYSTINHQVRFWYPFDTRISDKDFIELMKHIINLNRYVCTPDADLKILNKMCEDFVKKYDSLNLEKIPNSEIVLRDTYYKILSSLISEAVLFVTIKYLEEKDEDILNLLNSLPRLIASRILLYQIPIKPIKSKIFAWSIFETFYRSSKNATPEQYKQTIDFFENNKDFLMLDAIGGEFKERIEKQYIEFIETERKILLDKLEGKVSDK
jgi:hypothetical protein